MMTRVAVLDDWQDVARTSTGWSPLEARAEVVFFQQAFQDENDAATRLVDFEIILSMRERTPLPGSLISRLPRLQMLGITGARNPSLDTSACTARGVVVCNTVGSGATEAATAELALGLLLAAARAIPAGDANVRAGRFQLGVPVGISLAGKTMGIIGLGRLGSHMARYCRALNMRVLAWSQNLTLEKAQSAGATLVSKEELLSKSDAVSIHLVLSPRTRGLIAAPEITRMKPGAILINTSRGPIVDESALLEALHARRIVAGLDVFDRERCLPAIRCAARQTRS
jgi:phosphoglycerate dehydrogenase-like enzyme